MSRQLRLLAILLVLVLPTACASVNQTMDSWMGHRESELILSWGPPDRVASDGNGGTILIYSSYRDLGQTPGRYGGGYYTAPRANGYNAVRMFYVGPDGIIYSWRWQGL